jgi:hypothetical protein
MATKLYLVSSSDEYCDFSAIVEATDPNDAVNQWHNWLQVFDPEAYKTNESTPPRMVFELPEKTGKSRFFHWHTQDGVIEHEI